MNLIEINDYYEYEIEISLKRTSGQIIENTVIVEVRLYEKNTLGGEKAGGGTTTRSLINTFKEEVKRPNILQFLLGLSWQDRINSARDCLKNKAIYNAAIRWHQEIFPKEIRHLLSEEDRIR
ncbi:gp677 [Bacillus phage G]|uniref:Gp677 n=1 Tax=Bacillus phage G TaxID=2884420 RepID=G3MB57_9CAUD|nr:gp677 [Bacillus phage G]AEO93920.1 gp677 [Bacillus phage G]